MCQHQPNNNRLHQTTYDYKNRLLADDTKVSHRVNDAEKSLHGLGLFANHGFVDGQGQVVVVKVLLHLVTIDVEDVQVHDGQTPAPALIALGQIVVGRVEDAIEEGEVVFNLLVPLDMEAVLGLDDGSLQV